MPARRLELLPLALDLLEQLGVLDRQHRLVGQRLHQLDRLRGERARRLTAEHERPDQAVLAHERHREQRAITRPADDVVERVIGLAVDVGDLHRGALQAGAAGHALAEPRGPARQRLDHVRVQLVGGLDVKDLGTLVVGAEHAGVRPGERHGMGGDAAQHRLQLERRVDRLADLAQRPQLRDRTGQLAGARLHLVEQAHVLDRDHGLVGEGRDQLDLFVRERPDDVARQYDHADHRAAAQERHPEHGPESAFRLRLGPSVLRILEDVGDVHRPAFERGTAGHRFPAGHDEPLRQVAQELRVVSDRSGEAIDASGFELVHGRPFRVAEAGGGGDDRVQHRLQLGGRAADDAQHLAARGLPLERLAQLLRALLDLLVEAPELLGGAVDVGGERAELVAVADRHPLGELAGCDPAQARGDLGERSHDRPREDVA